MTPTRLAQGIANTAIDSVRHPLTTASRAVGLAKGAASVALKAPGIVTDTLTSRTTACPPSPPGGDRGEPVAKPDPHAPEPGSAKREETEAPTTTTPVADHTEPAVPDLEPPDPADRVLVVEEALAAEQDQPRFGRTTEPHAASRDEEHGESALHPAELEELDEEAETRE